MLICKEEAEHTRISLATRVLNIAKLGSKGSQAEATEFAKEKREHKAPNLKPGRNQKKLDEKDAAKEQSLRDYS